jgi:hypothetical protein
MSAVTEAEPHSDPARRSSPNRAARAGTALVALLALVLAAWRADYVLSGVDPDTDAHAHYVIAREILANPTNLAVHWVWLPLFHYVEALAVGLGASMNAIRLANVALSALAPLGLALAAAARTPASSDPGAWRDRGSIAIACVVCALNPIAMQMGTTGQMEPLFCLVVLATAIALDRGRPELAAVALTAGVLLRYEAWALPPALLVHLALARVPAVRRRLPAWETNRSTEGRAAWLPIVVPALAIVAWAGLRRATIDPRWFAFLGATREFANGATGVQSSFSLGLAQTLTDAGFYLVKTPWRVMGWPLVLVPFGIVSSLRRDGLRWFALYGAVLSFLTLTWLLRSSLGLDRHFVAVVPFYALLAGRGAVELGGLAERLVVAVGGAHEAGRGRGQRAAALVVVTAGLLAAGTSAELLHRWMRDWRGASEGAWPDRKRMAATLARLDPPKVFCDEATVEILSGLPRERFHRRAITRERVLEVATREPVLLAVWGTRLRKLELPESVRVTPLDRTDGTTGDDGFVLLRAEPR